MHNHTKLSSLERDKIALYLARGISRRKIALVLGRSVSTISEEIRLNLVEGEYIACYAQNRAMERRSRSHQTCPLKNARVYAYVHNHLRAGWSPEQIAGRMAAEYPQDRSMRIVPETIYRYIYAKANRSKGLWEFLPRKQRKRKKWRGRSVHRERIPQRVSIHNRPEAVNQRQVKGHWEGDTMEGKQHRDSIHTEVERLSRYLMAQKVTTISSAAALSAQWQMFALLPPAMRQSTTLDNGRENHLHYHLQKLNMNTYFCDPYASYQKGCIENHNGLLRRYLPKGTNLSTLSDEELQDIVSEINHRPRKCLQFRTPHEVFSALALSSQPFIPFSSIPCSDSV